MSLREIVPTEDLRPWVDRYWMRPAAAEPLSLSILPDGCADLVLDLSGAPGPLTDAFAVGTMSRPLIITQQKIPEMFGIRFRPGRAAAFFRAPLAPLTDSRVPLHELAGRELAALAGRVAETPAERRVAVVEGALRKRLGSATAERRVEAAVEAILRTSGRLPVEEVAGRAGVTRQHLARLFDVHVGIPPKTFARIVRFRRAVRLGRGGRWADLAALLGYADQSHLIADFRAFAGTTPVPFFLEREAGAPLP
ncbi:MAG TPA: AraC family transcriptional regulator [Thermoanaerobaculia bacterium]|nr:AraC family transcriptional regulator [Thermoanaerobaculia bacterium]